MGRYKPGESGNPSGRPVGSRNRTAAEVAKRFLRILDDNLDDFEADLKALKPKERTAILVALGKHYTPGAFDPSRMTVEQLEEARDYFKKLSDESEEKNN